MKSVMNIHFFWIAATAFHFVGVAASKKNSAVDLTEKVSKASCDFTLGLLKHVESKHNSSNIVFSPASINILLSVIQQGAKGNTAAELQKLLRLTPDESRQGYHDLMDLKKEKNVTLEWGNRCYLKPEIELNDDFKKVAEEDFEVGIEKMDFGIPSPQASADKMNDWVREATHDQIKNLVDPQSISLDTIMVMINAIFFKGTWSRPFKKGKTALDKFEMSSTESIQTLFMSQREKYYADKDTDLGAKWVQQPFQNDRFSMVFILPTKRHRLNKLLNKMTGEDLHNIFGSLGVSHVKLRIPKFKISEKVSLVQTLSELGLKDIFTPASDLSGISSTAGNLQVSDVIHQANLEIDEKGGTGSAATVVQFLRMRTPTLTFTANQPFLFFIVDVKSKIPLFAGKVINPKS